MLYTLLKPLIQLTIRLFFRNYQVNGLKNIPKKGPFIFVANHPATFMDPAIIAATLKTKVHFIAKSTVFRSRFAKWFLPKLNMIPVYRKHDDPTQVDKNEQMFETCFKHLSEGGNILIFPEGISLPERKIKDVKSGAARIALGAEERNGFNLDIKIIVIGLNYSDNGKFQSNVLVNIGEPISIKEYKEQYVNDSIKTVKKISNQIKEGLETLTVSIQEEESDILVKRVEEVYKTQILDEIGVPKRKKIHDFNVTKAICDYLAYFKTNAPWKLHFIKEKVDAYYTELDKIGMTDGHLRQITSGKNVVNRTLLSLLYFVLMFPVFLSGLITNYIPYCLTIFLTRKISPYLEYRVAIAMVVGMFLFLINIAGLTILGNFLFHSFWLNCILLFTIPVTGLFAYKYNQYFIKTMKRWKMFTLFYKNNALMTKLLQMRSEIITEFENLRVQYEEKTVVA
jgi:glycerol-3-phosphate O-acyltransferase / dihydroxyacetone phosphate acyltransferase